MGFRDIKYKTMYISGVDNLVEDFYIPTLKESILYRRRTGYFNSRALAMAARGISVLLKNNGKMQLLCSVQLDQAEREVYQDPEAYLNRHVQNVLEMLDKPYDTLEKTRLALLAELLYRQKLEIKIAIPEKGGIYHEKVGIFTDKNEDVVAFSGSGNETPGGWFKNTESFHTYTTYEDMRHIKPEIEIFERLWDSNLPGTHVFSLPEAIERKILSFRDYYKDGIDEPIDPTDWGIITELHWQWTPQLAYVFEAKRLWNHTDFAYGETAVNPYEHQDHIASTVLQNWPPRHLLCDEVGLGKTIEAGLCIKGFIASGRVNRLLILAPKSVLKQWQLEMKTKFNIDVWRLDGDYVYAPQLDPNIPVEKIPVDPYNPFSTKRFLLVSSQLVRSEQRQEQLLKLEYDLVVLDEAHHARAHRDSGGRRTPKKLLNLMEDLRYNTQGLLMLTATPIQLNRLELWDLLNILEMPGLWQDEQTFDLFFKNINSDNPDWRFLINVVQSSLQRWDLDTEALKDIKAAYPSIDVYSIANTVKTNNYTLASQYNNQEQDALKQILYAHTPIRKMVFRNSRELLKEYKRQGKFKGEIADRIADKRKIHLQGTSTDATSEQGIYNRIEDYVKHYYSQYSALNKGLGFVMVIYRKRLTSSFKAVEKSLERRKEKLQRAIETGDIREVFPNIDEIDEDEEYETLIEDYDEFIPQTLSKRKDLFELFEREREYIDDFLNDLSHLTTDTKVIELKKLLDQKLTGGSHQVIIFSQYKDTVEFLLEYFRDIYANKIGSYSGDGGKYWDGSSWQLCSKQEIQERFADKNNPLSILFCTDAASEGLNLQTCNVLINYDIPWNPMRIEQRIGRVDRIGQKNPNVYIYTIFYENSVEERVYNVCEERIRECKTTLGNLQPILEPATKTIQEAALASTKEESDRIIKDFEKTYDYKTVAQKNEEINIKKFVNCYNPRLPSLSTKVPFNYQSLTEIMTPFLENHGWAQDEEYFIKNNITITFNPFVIDTKSRPAKLVTPTSNLPELFKNLPPMPEQFNTPKPVYRVMAKGYTGYTIKSNNSFYLISKLNEFSNPTGESYTSLDSLNKALHTKLLQRRKDIIKENLKTWNFRKQSWEYKVRIYLEKIAYFRWKEITKGGGIEAYNKDTLAKDWYQYITKSDRITLKNLNDLIQYQPDFDDFIKRGRKRGFRKSPRDYRIEIQYLNELKRVNEKIETYQKEEKSL